MRRARQPSVGRGALQVMVQRGVIPGQTVLVHQSLEASEELFRQRGGVGCVTGIAKIDPASQRSSVPSRTTARVVLPRTGFTLVQRSRGRWRFGKQKGGLGFRKEQRMVILRESAAATAQLADWLEALNGGVQVRVEGRQGRAKTVGGGWVGFR